LKPICKNSIIELISILSNKERSIDSLWYNSVRTRLSTSFARSNIKAEDSDVADILAKADLRISLEN
jgi:hypothetical protein